MNDTKVKIYTSLTAPDDIGLVTHADYRALEEECYALKSLVDMCNRVVADLRSALETIRDDASCTPAKAINIAERATS